MSSWVRDARTKRDDLYVATPPLETIKYLVAKCAMGQRRSQPLRMGIVDVRRAYFYAKASRPIYIEVPLEDRKPGDEDKVGLLEMSLYGTRDAGLNWSREVAVTMQRMGFRRGKASTCNYHHPGRKIDITVHGDDFMIIGSSVEAKWSIKGNRK